MLLIPLALVLGLAAAPSALAGGWATAGLSSTPDGVDAGKPWKVDITIMQHGRTPLEGVQPAIVITDEAGRATRFDAKAAGEPGVYSATVVFPGNGTYDYTVDDGFGNAFGHEFAPVEIGGPAVAPVTPASDRAPAAARPAVPAHGTGGTPWWPFALAAVLLGAAVGAVRLRRRRGAAPLPA
jgi:hypothetical protein